MAKKFMTTFKISKEINYKMLHKIVDKNSSLRGKSEWIIEAIENFLEIKGYPELVDIADEMIELNETVSFRMPESLLKKLDDAVIKVRIKYPTIEGVKSNIIRASIVQQLIRTNSQ